MRIRDLGEFKLIKRFAGSTNLDDTAVLKYKKDRYLLFTTDMLLEGRHFRKSASPYLIGKKSLSVNISDIAAMGGIPKCAVISLGLPGSLKVKYVDAIYKGIRGVAGKFKVDLVGGDTICSKKIIINIALLGEVEKKNLVLRSGAKKGDAIFVTGSIGGSLKGKHLKFTPRLKEARFLTKNFNIHSMIDVSDGLLADLGHILERSNVGAVIDEKAIPLTGSIEDGEDFELVFTISKKDVKKLVKSWPFKTRLSRIGEITGKEKKLPAKGYNHFKS